MKKTVKYLAFFLGLALASCSKNEIAPDPKPVEGPKMQVTLNAGATKTALVQDGKTDKFNPIWTAGDKLGVFVHSNGSEVDNNVATTALAADTETATFSASVTQPTQAAKYKFYAYYPYSSLDDQSNTNVRVNIPTEQYPANGSFDPKADVLSGLPKEVNVTAGQTEITGLELQFMRKTSVVRFLIPSCQDFEGITKDTYVEEVKVYFDKPVAGVANFNIENTDDITLEAGRDSSVVTLKYASNTHKVSDPLWLSIAPVDGVKSLTFAFKVADNAYLYAKADISKGVDFTAGGMIKFDIPISGTKWELKSFQKKYVKVTSTPESWLGKYLIVGANEDNLYACDQVSTGSWGSCTAVTAETDGSIIGTADINNYAFDVVPGIEDETYAFKFTSGNYKGQFVSSGAAKNFNVLEDADKEKTDFTLAVDGNYVTIASKTTDTRQLRYNHNNGSGGLRFYDGTTGVGVSLYKQVDDYSAIVPVIANPEGIPAEVGKEGVVDAQFTAGITNLSKYSVSIDGETCIDKTVVTAASVSYDSSTHTATVTYSVSANTGEPRDGWIILKAGPTERKIDIHQATGIVLPVITPVSDQNITYEASDARSFDVTIANKGSFEISFETDETVVTSAEATLKSGDVYSVTYTVTENVSMESRNGSITIKCSTESSTVNIIQDYNKAAVKTYKRVASLGDIEPGRYVIIASTSTITSYLPNAATSSAPVVEKTGFICTDNEFKTIKDSTMAWDFTGTTSAMTIKSAADSTNYLYNIANNNGTRVGNTKDTWTIVKHSSNTADNLFQFQDANNSRFVGIYGNADWRSYTSATAQNYTAATGSSKIKLYLFDDGKTKPTITTTPKSITTLGSQDVSEMFSSNSDGAKSYNVSGGTLDGTTFTASEAGSYTVTMTQEATATYKAAQAQATITVTAASTLDAPEILTEGDNANKKITVTWEDVTNATSYTVHCNSATHDVSSGVEIYEITGLEYGVQYDIYVSASADGYYPSESEHKAVTLTDPAVQTLASPVVTTSVSGTIVTVNWVDVANATSYYVECGTQNTTFGSGVQTAEFTCTAGQYNVKVTAKATGYNDGVSATSQVQVYEKLATPTGLTAPSASITSSSIKLTWNAVSHADAGYQVSNDGTNWTDVAAGTTEYTFTGLDASTEYTLQVKAKASGYYTVSDAASKTVTTAGDVKTYHHTFSTKPNTGNNVTLSNMNWNISATALNAYNSGYAGVQFGTSKAIGDITLTSSSAWSYQSTSNVKEIRVWLNTGGGTITPTVTIGGTSVASDGTTVSKKSSLDGDYRKANKVTFKPSSSMTGVIIISVAKTPASGGAGYICAIEVDSE